ncbi:hypothetical protein PsYK624_148450 [Phanerochaete sordida]|uniref:F-box domain-containing protein n=1 Tax=Phanerochaete sordida TaxID=48140 RepID=A0A9P3GPR0_9APHY|nr:hypothetical protein PsYK624_148450 [Phanerochaete sordida]
MTTIRSLPIELLAQVLKCSAQDTQETWIQHLLDNPKAAPAESAYDPVSRPIPRERVLDDPQPAPERMVALARVSRVWHDVTSAHSTLWAHVDVRDDAATIAMLKRAGAQPLTVTFRLPNAELSAEARKDPDSRTALFRKILESYIGRIDTLVMPLLPELQTAQFASLATRLRRLIFIEPSPEIFDTEPAHAPLLTHSAFPVLTTLVCRAPLWATLTPLCVSTLTTLELFRTNPPSPEEMYDEDDEDDAYTTSMDELLRALAKMPRLEHLAVEISEEPFNVPDTLALPQLRSLRVRAATDVCAALLRCLQLPRDVKLALQCLYGDSGPAECNVLDLPRLLAEVFTDPSTLSSSFAPVRTAALSGTQLGYTLCGWRDERALTGTGSDAPPDVALALPLGAAHADFRTVLGALPLAELTSARLHGSLSWMRGEPVFACAKAFCCAPRLERLALECLYPSIAWEILAATPATRIYLDHVQFEWEDDMRGDRKRTEQAERAWRRTFEFTDHILEFRAVLEKRKTLGLQPWTEMRGTEYHQKTENPIILEGLTRETWKRLFGRAK